MMGKIIERVRKRQRAAHEKHRQERPYYDVKEDEWVTFYEAVKRGMLTPPDKLSGVYHTTEFVKPAWLGWF